MLFLKIVPVSPIELPLLSSLDPAALVLSVLAAVALFRWRLGVLHTLVVRVRPAARCLAWLGWSTATICL